MLLVLTASLFAVLPDAGVPRAQGAVVEKPNSRHKKTQIQPKEFYELALADVAPPIVTAEELKAWLTEKSATLIDLRSAESYSKEHLEQAVNLPATEMTDEMVAQLLPNKAARVVVYCDFQLFPSRRVAVTTLGVPTLRRLGYTDVRLLEALWSRKEPPEKRKNNPGGLSFVKRP
jgi:Rhodanese-like domain